MAEEIQGQGLLMCERISRRHGNTQVVATFLVMANQYRQKAAASMEQLNAGEAGVVL